MALFNQMKIPVLLVIFKRPSTTHIGVDVPVVLLITGKK